MKNRIVSSLVKFPGIVLLRFFDFVTQTATQTPTVVSPDNIAFIELLSNNREIILQEYFEDIYNKRPYNVKDFYKVDTDINYDDNWKAVPLILFGYMFIENSLRYPKTFKLLNQIPGCAGAMFSVLGPGKYIPPHHGIYKGVFRCLFTLKVKDGAKCWIRVSDRVINFETGKAVLFDETAEHEVANYSDEPRIVLYLDIYRKLPFPVNLLNSLVFALLRRSPFVKNILTEYSKLEPVSFKDFQWLPATFS